MEKISVNSVKELIEVLKNIDISVPLRTEGRTKEHCERWAICRWLSSVSRSSYLDFPLTVTHQNRPDFYLKSANQEIGAECTEAIPEDYAHVSAISEKQDSETAIDMSLFKWGQKKTAKEIYNIASRNKLTGPGWEDDSPEHEWAEAIAKITENKTILLRKRDFKKYQINILLVYDNLPLPIIDRNKASTFLKGRLAQYWNDGLAFDNIFIENGDCIIAFNQKEVKNLDLNNLWKRI